MATTQRDDISYMRKTLIPSKYTICMASIIMIKPAMFKELGTILCRKEYTRACINVLATWLKHYKFGGQLHLDVNNA